MGDHSGACWLTEAGVFGLVGMTQDSECLGGSSAHEPSQGAVRKAEVQKKQGPSRRPAALRAQCGPRPGGSASRPCWGRSQPCPSTPQASAASLLSAGQLRQVLDIAGAQARGRAWSLGPLLDRMLPQTLSPEPRLTLMATAVHPKTLLGGVTSGQAPTSRPRHLRLQFGGCLGVEGG